MMGLRENLHKQLFQENHERYNLETGWVGYKGTSRSEFPMGRTRHNQVGPCRRSCPFIFNEPLLGRHAGIPLPRENSPVTRRFDADNGVSAVVGELLMVGLVILLVAAFSSVLWNILPTAHDPSVTVMMTNDTTHVVLWHKGGDWIKADEITIIIGNDRDTRKKYSLKDTPAAFHLVPKKDVFDLGSNITVDIPGGFPAGLTADETVSLVTPRAQVFSGKVRT